MAKKRNRITVEMSKTIANSSPLIKKANTMLIDDENIISINLNNLKQNPYQPRININIQSLNDLISSIEENGLLQPIIVTQKDENGNHTIIAGHRRYEAFKIMGKESIKAIVKKDINDKDLAILSLTENLLRENLHPIENAIAMKNILDQKIVGSQNKLAQYLGLSKGYVSKLFNILNLPDVIINKIKLENYKDINILVLLNKISDIKEMEKAYEKVKTLPRNEAEKYIKNNYINKIDKDNNIVTIHKTRNKLNFAVNIKDIPEKKMKTIEEKINKLNNEIQSLLEEK